MLPFQEECTSAKSNLSLAKIADRLKDDDVRQLLPQRVQGLPRARRRLARQCATTNTR